MSRIPKSIAVALTSLLNSQAEFLIAPWVFPNEGPTDGGCVCHTQQFNLACYHSPPRPQEPS